MEKKGKKRKAGGKGLFGGVEIENKRTKSATRGPGTHRARSLVTRGRLKEGGEDSYGENETSTFGG